MKTRPEKHHRLHAHEINRWGGLEALPGCGIDWNTLVAGPVHCRSIGVEIIRNHYARVGVSSHAPAKILAANTPGGARTPISFILFFQSKNGERLGDELGVSVITVNFLRVMAARLNRLPGKSIRCFPMSPGLASTGQVSASSGQLNAAFYGHFQANLPRSRAFPLGEETLAVDGGRPAGAGRCAAASEVERSNLHQQPIGFASLDQLRRSSCCSGRRSGANLEGPSLWLQMDERQRSQQSDHRVPIRLALRLPAVIADSGSALRRLLAPIPGLAAVSFSRFPAVAIAGNHSWPIESVEFPLIHATCTRHCTGRQKAQSQRCAR